MSTERGNGCAAEGPAKKGQAIVAIKKAADKTLKKQILSKMTLLTGLPCGYRLDGESTPWLRIQHRSD
jgi:hypothetical protein